MRSIVSRFFCLIACLLLFVDAAAQQEVPKDAQAVAVLGQMAAATGWNRLTLPADAIAVGSVARVVSETHDTVTITLKTRGFHQYRTEVASGASTTTTIINGGLGAVVRPEGTEFIPGHAALSMRPLVFPFFSDLVAFADADVSVRYLGLESVRDEPAHKVEITRASTVNHPAGRTHRDPGLLTAWISAKNGLPVQIAYTRVALSNRWAVAQRVRYLSDYHNIGGIVVPFRQEEFARDRLLYVLQLTSVQFNAGLSEADFAVPASQE